MAKPILAARPVAGQPIETTWGQQVHDDINRVLVQSGRATAPNSGTATAQLTVVFPVPYTVAPNIVVSVAAASSTFIVGTNAVVEGSPLVQFAALVFRRDGSNVNAAVTFDWVAVGVA